jgi:hypothetical protein
MTATVPFSIMCSRLKVFLLLPWLALARGSEPAMQIDAARGFVQSYCSGCHNDKKQKGRTNLTPFLRNDTVEQSLLLSAYDQLKLGEMPPEEEEQPSRSDRARMIAFLSGALSASGSRTLDKASLPGYGNYVNHEDLFEAELTDDGPESLPSQRLWRYSPESFSERVNRIAGHEVIKFVPVATFPVPQTGLKHPAFPYKGPAHALKDYSNIHDFGLTETELLIKLAEELAAAQLSSGSLRVWQSLPLGDAKWTGLLGEQFQKLYSRTPTDTELRQLLALQEKVAADAGIETANQTMIAATYLRPETLFRFEVGGTASAGAGHVNLAPIEYAYAVGLALNRTGPAPQLVEALLEYEKKERKDLKRVIRPWLDDKDAHQRIMRFMAEYFEYGQAAFVFKDEIHHRRYRPEWLIEDADKFVSRIVERDRNVVRELLTSTEFSVRGAFNNANAAKWHQDESNGHRFYHTCYNLEQDELGKDPEWHDLDGERAGILTHPAWLIAFSDNTKNHAIQRGRWIQTKLLGGVIPDTPVEVDARFPEDPALTLREKMKVVRKEECWKCHRRMDPLGLPLEQFDLWGRHRTEELERPVVTTGEFDGQAVANPFEMMHRLADSKRVHQVFLRHVFRFFCGRNETLGDARTLRDMERAYHQDQGSLKAAILELLVSDSFTQRSRPIPKNQDPIP